MSLHYSHLTGTPVTKREILEELIRTDYERTHPDDTFDDFRRRAEFDKHDKGLLKDWFAVAAERHFRKLELERLSEKGPCGSLLAMFDEK